MNECNARRLLRCRDVGRAWDVVMWVASLDMLMGRVMRVPFAIVLRHWRKECVVDFVMH